MNLGFVHTPVADGDCIDCHDPHQGSNSHFLLNPPAMVDGRRVVSATCLACHEAGDSSWFDDFHATEAILDCTICHNAHASQEKFQLTRYVRDVYLRSAVMDGDELREQGNLEGATEAYRNALSVFPKDLPTALLLAEVYLAREKWQAAYETYADILDSKPQNVDALIGAGDAVIGNDDPAEALAYYKKAMEAAPGHAGIRVRVGNIYRSRGQLQESLAELGKAVELDPESPQAYRDLTATYKAMGNDAEAAKALEKYEALTTK
jgi:predicted CXXCH cytochrome family protein